MKRALPLLALLLTACASTPPAQRPAAPAFQKAWKVPEGFKRASPADDHIQGDWWRVYHDPVLDDLEGQVAQANQTLAQADAQYRLAKAVLASSEASLFPTANLTVSGTRSQQPILTSGGGLASPPASNLYNLAVAASWEPDLWGAIHNAVSSSQESLYAAAANRAAVLLSLQASLATSYFQLRTADATIHLLSETVAAYQRSLTLTQARLASGVAGRTDVTQAQSQLASAQASLSDARITRDVQEHAIAVLTGHAAQDFHLDARPDSVLDQWPAIPLAVPSTLLERRPDIANAERQVTAQAAKLLATDAAFFPVVTLNANAGFESKNFRKWLSLPTSLWSIGPQLTQYLLDGGNHIAVHDQAVATLDQLTANYREVVIESFQSVEDQLSSVAWLEEEHRRDTAAAQAAAATLELVNRQYQAGTVAYLNVLSAQTTLLSAQLSALSTAGRWAGAHVALIRALGGGWQESSLHIGG